MSYDMLLGRNLLEVANLQVIDGIPHVTKTVTDEVRELMLIDHHYEKPTLRELECITSIEDSHAGEAVIQMVEDYVPIVPKQSCIQMEIEVTDNVPVHQNPRRLSPVEREATQELIREYIEQGIVRPSRSPYASPILLRKKKNGRYTLCVDYRKINLKIVKDRYPLPLMESVLDGLHGQNIFSSIDLKNGFFHVDMAPASVKYTSFVTPDGQYEFLKAPFGLCNSPAIFQRYINQVLFEAQRKKLVSLYLDDVLLPSVTVEDNLAKLRAVFRIAAESGMLINWEKCEFLKKKITFLGYVIERGTIKPSDEKTLAIRNFPQPTNVRTVQSFLGLTGYFRKFIPRYGTTARPLSELLRKDVKFHMGDAECEAFHALKSALAEQPVLRMYAQGAETELHTDASSRGYGGCLMQRQADDGEFHPTFHISYKTTPAESKWHSYELEVLAIIKCLERLRVYVMGTKFTIVTDCEAFERTMKHKNTTAKVARWALALEEYDVVVRHRAGSKMAHVDALSRNAVMAIETGIFEQIKAAQAQDSNCATIKQLLEKECDTPHVIRGGVIYHFHDGHYRLRVPKSMAESVVRQIHGDVHLSRRRVLHAVEQDYFIDNLGKLVDKVLRNCVVCILATAKKGKQDGWLRPIDKGDVPLHTFHVDHTGQLESTAKKYQYILVVVDAFTKFVWLYPTKTTSCGEAVLISAVNRQFSVILPGSWRTRGPPSKQQNSRSSASRKTSNYT